MQLSCEHCGRVYDSKLTRSGGLECCPKCEKLNLFIPTSSVHYIVFGDYLIQEKIGTGGNAVVVRAKHLATNEVVALKLFLSKREAGDLATKEFISEIEMASQLIHDNIVRIYSGGEIDEILFIVMEYVDGINLSEYLELYGAMPTPDALSVGIHVCNALEHVWSNFLMIHRDVKPQNIMITTNGDIKLCDFGLVSCHEKALNDDNAILGTPYYVSPEMVEGDTYLDNRSDIYSLGTTLYHMLAGAPPFKYGGLMEVLSSRTQLPPPELKQQHPDIPQGISDVVKTMMATEQEGRYATAVEAASDLLLVRDGGQPNLVDSNRERLNQ
ncbi:MAG: protein kinase [Lentisphaeraceae bacterium]|nr:protein kinase [Lentisphaeraceae bacterium]